MIRSFNDVIERPLEKIERNSAGEEDAVVIKRAMPWLRRASEMGLGASASANIELVEIDL